MKHILWITLAALLVLAAANLFVPVISVLLLVFAGILFGVFLNGVSQWIANHTPLGYRGSYTVIVVLLIALIAGGFYYLGATIAAQATQFSQQLSSAGSQFIDWLGQRGVRPSELKQLMPKTSTAATQLTNAAAASLWGVTGLIVIFFIGVYTAYEPDLYKNGSIKLVHPDQRSQCAEVLDKVRSALSRWMIGRIASMLIVGVATAIGLAVLGVPMAIALGVLASLLTFIPNIGPIIAAIPQVLLAFQAGGNTVLWVIVLNLVLQGVESYLVTPVVQRYVVSLPPALTITVQLLFGVMFGLVGVLTAAPLTVVAIIVVQSLYIRDRLGDVETEAGLG